MRRGRGYPVAVVVLLALLVSATALLGRGFGTGAAFPPAPISRKSLEGYYPLKSL